MMYFNPRGIFIGCLVALVCLPLLAVAQQDPGCCVNRVGDVNGLDGDEPTLGDIMYLVNFLYINPAVVPPCIAEADVNQSGGIVPVLTDITLADIMVLVDYLFVSGSSAGLAECLVHSSEPYGYVVSLGRCKELNDPPLTPDEAGFSCVQYDYDGQGALSLIHQNAGMNCCPVPTLTVLVEGSTITITEVDSGLCDCNCLYDIVYRVDNLAPGPYRIIVNEAIPNQGDPLDFVADLVQSPSGVFCVGRSEYPWGGGVAGVVTGHSGCKTHGAAAAAVATSTDMTCVTYEYDGSGVLTLKHENAGFNCCPEYLTADFEFDGSTITITEREVLDQGGCLCLCLFDLNMAILNLPPGQYRMVIIEPYLSGNDQPIDFMVDLETAPSGMHCLERTEYPWGALIQATGALVSRTDCKSSGGEALADSIPSDQSCLVYEYDGSGTLAFTHANAGFNCCPTALSAWFSFENDIIRVHEVEDLSGGGCHCLCLYDLHFEVMNVPPGVYTVEIVEPYLGEGETPLIVTLDLTAAGSGTRCVERLVYPWGQ